LRPARRDDDLRGLRAFHDAYPEATPFLLCRGRERLKIGEILSIPVDEFVLGLAPGQGILEGA